MNLIHLKRAIHKIPDRFNSIQFNSAGTVIVNGQPEPDFEFYPEDYDYNDRNETIDQAFAVYLTKPFTFSKSMSAKYNPRTRKTTITVRHDELITFVSDIKNPPKDKS
jgi:hypothetical protein